MKILLATGLYPPQIGGHAKYAEAIHDKLVGRSIEAPVVSFGEVKHLPPLVRHLVYVWRLFVHSRGSNAILAFDTWSVGMPALFVARLRHVPLVVRVGGDFLWESYIERGGELVPLPQFYAVPRKFTLKERIIRRGTRAIATYAAKLVFNSAWQRDIWLKAYDIPLERTAIVENEYTGFVAAEPPANKSFVAAGRATRLKNIPMLAGAIEAVKAAHPDGALDMRTLSREEHTERLRRAYAVVVPSISDMNPNMIWEGLAFGKPFICTKYTGITERLKDLGIFFNPADERELKAAIEELLNPEKYAGYVERIRAFSYRHTWEQITDEILAAIPKRI